MRPIYIILFVVFYQFSYSQACGGGKFVFEFYTKNDNELLYEISQVEFKDEKLLFENLNDGIVIDSTKLQSLAQSKFHKEKLPKFISQSISSNNKIENNELVFSTLESYSRVYLLTVWNKKNKIYILTNLFGGCNRKNIVIMAEKPKMISIDYNR
ncbi:hypothetical protein [uncultured Flavobacterium sp.]|uniref:hypothetical protein n=1 Tax=uncultured Flavobacterium sp. TaxID=165435 RepID=UPI0025E2BA07|nr:hypothetical protein [uncultured Flavobacterium sp.]